MPDESAISVVTLAELYAGVLAATDTPTRAVRMATVDALADVEVLPIDERAAIRWAQLRVLLAESGRRVNVNDLWIAATAAARGLPRHGRRADHQGLISTGRGKRGGRAGGWPGAAVGAAGS